MIFCGSVLHRRNVEGAFLKDEAPLSFVELYSICSGRSSFTLTALFSLETSWWTWWSQATPSGGGGDSGNAESERDSSGTDIETAAEVMMDAFATDF